MRKGAKAPNSLTGHSTLPARGREGPMKQHDFQIAKVPSPTKVARGRRRNLSLRTVCHQSSRGRPRPQQQVRRTVPEHSCGGGLHCRARDTRAHAPRRRGLRATAAPPAPHPPRTLHRTPRPPGGGGQATRRPPAEPLRPSSLHSGRRAFQQRQPFPEEVWFLLSVFSLFIKLLMQSYYHA